MRAGSVALLLPAVLAAGVSVAGAQQHAPPPATAQPSTTAPPTAPLPPAPAALTVPNPLAGLKPGPRDLYRSPDGSDRFQHLSRHPAPPVVVPGGYFPGFYGYAPFYPPDPYLYGTSATDMRSSPRSPEMAPQGSLVLETIPDIAQVFVDGYYVGVAEEFGLRGKAMNIAAGTHRVELRAPGYETLAFSVMVAPNDIVRYRGGLQPLPAARPAPVAAPSTPKSFYIIPNCYAGDKPPSGALPKGCDPKKLRKI